MGEPPPHGPYEDSDEAQPQAEQDSLDKLRRLLGGRRLRFWIVVLVALLWLLAECTHRSRDATAAEPLLEFNATTSSTRACSTTVPNSLEPRRIGLY
jgi:di/tricarboxylate transporter